MSLANGHFYSIENDTTMKQIGMAIGTFVRARAAACLASKTTAGTVSVIERDSEWKMVAFKGVASRGEYTRIVRG